MAADPEVLTDPFFGVVARRHPDATVILLPAETTSPEADGASVDHLSAGDFEDRSGNDLAELDRWVGRVLAGHDVVQESDEGWAPVAPDAVSRRQLFAVVDIEPESAATAIQAAVDSLTAEGWEVVEEHDGLPRLRARRGALTLKLLYVVPAARLALVASAGPYPLDPDTRARLIEGEARA